MTDKTDVQAMSAARRALENWPCTCVLCSSCDGQGTYRVDTNSWPEDDLETCDECHGSGIVETCERCQELIEMEYDELS